MKPCPDCSISIANIRTRCKWCEKDRRMDYDLRKQYGISADDYWSMLAKQNGCCLICYHKPSTGARRLAVDHCHTTGKVRGLLCSRCNTALGLFRDNPMMLEAAKRYLLEHQE